MTAVGARLRSKSAWRFLTRRKSEKRFFFHTKFRARNDAEPLSSLSPASGGDVRGALDGLLGWGCRARLFAVVLMASSRAESELSNCAGASMKTLSMFLLL